MAARTHNTRNARRTRRPTRSREALLAAATDEFALQGFDGASVDLIAARAGVNKAMIYYHFKSKQRLYVEILRGVFSAMGARTAAVADTNAPATQKIAAFAAAISAEADARPYIPPIMMREIAEGARRLDADTLRLMSRLFTNLRAILEQGVREGTFRPANPLLTYFSLISPIFFFRAARPVRDAMDRHGLVPGVSALDDDVLLAHVTENLLHALAPDRPAAAARKGTRKAPAPTRRPRHGEHA
jgi:AcrR family transcriptional regulator